MTGWERIAARSCILILILHFQDARHRLLFEPFLDVAFVRPRARCQLGGRGRAAFRQGAVETQTIANINGEHAERPRGEPQEAFYEGVTLAVNGLRRHRQCAGHGNLRLSCSTLDWLVSLYYMEIPP